MNLKRFNPFRRKDQDVNPEFSSYYQSADTSNQGNMAVVLGFVTLLAAMLLVVGLFLGGRWLYDKLTDKDDKVTISNEGAKTENKTDSSKPATNNDADKKPTQIPGNDTATGTSSTSTSATAGTSTMSTSSSAIPQTGPEDIVTIPRTGVE